MCRLQYTRAILHDVCTAVSSQVSAVSTVYSTVPVLCTEKCNWLRWQILFSVGYGDIWPTVRSIGLALDVDCGHGCCVIGYNVSHSSLELDNRYAWTMKSLGCRESGYTGSGYSRE